MGNKIVKGLCSNCDAAITGKFCARCGQSAAIGRITFKETINEFLSAYFSYEGPLLHTLRWLVLNPGRVFREFIAGKRKQYYKPVSLFVLLTAVYIIIRILIGFDPFGTEEALSSENARIAEIQNRSMMAQRYMVHNINYIMFFLVISIGLMLKVFFSKQYNLAEYTTVGFYIGGLYIFVGTIFMLINKYLSVPLVGQVQLLFLVGLIFYSTYSLFQRWSFWPLTKYLMVSVLSVILYMLLGFGFSYLSVSVG